MALLGLVAQVCAAENPPKVALDNNEVVIYGSDRDQLLAAMIRNWTVSDPLRAQIRAEVAKTIEASAEAKESTQVMCQFYAEHQQADPARTLAQYVSLALFLECST